MTQQRVRRRQVRLVERMLVPSLGHRAKTQVGLAQRVGLMLRLRVVKNRPQITKLIRLFST